jgi:DNA-binding NarL/FixJ family response regulator
MYFVSITIGLILIISSLFLIRNEFNKAIHAQARMLEQSKLYNEADLFQLLENMQGTIDEVNRAFYEIAADLEGKYSIHEKELVDLNRAVQALKKQYDQKNVQQLVSEPTYVEKAPKPAHPKSNLSEKDALRKEVRELRDQGMSASQIAKELNLGIGEVQLFLRIKQ